MGKWSIYIPDGVQDLLPEQCGNKRKIESIIRNHLTAENYLEIETPTIEFYDVYDSEAAFMPQETMYKFFDKEGRILVLRPDFTVPVARITATRFRESDFPCRLFYIGNTFRYDEMGGGKMNEFTQAGVEFLGEKNAKADAEVVAQAIYCLKKAGLPEFQIDIGQVEFFKGIMEEAGFSQTDAEEARALIDRKNYPGLEELVSKHDMDENIRCIMLDIPKLFGSVSMLEKLSDKKLNKKSLSAISNLKKIFEILSDNGLSQYVSLDLGMVSSLNYYTGMIFKGFTHGIGYPVLSGGRYDRLVGSFGKDCPATGFSIGVNMLLTALEKYPGSDTVTEMEAK